MSDWQKIEKKEKMGNRSLKEYFLAEIWPNLRHEKALVYVKEEEVNWEKLSDEEKETCLNRAKKWLDNHPIYRDQCWTTYRRDHPQMVSEVPKKKDLVKKDPAKKNNIKKPSGNIFDLLDGI